MTYATAPLMTYVLGQAALQSVPNEGGRLVWVLCPSNILRKLILTYNVYSLHTIAFLKALFIYF